GPRREGRDRQPAQRDHGSLAQAHVRVPCGGRGRATGRRVLRDPSPLFRRGWPVRGPPQLRSRLVAPPQTPRPARADRGICLDRRRSPRRCRDRRCFRRSGDRDPAELRMDAALKAKITSAGYRPDPVTTEIVRNGLIAATEEMKTNLMRTAYNMIIYEALDFTVGLFD